MTAYSIDFRKKIVSAYAAGNTSIRKVAERFSVTQGTVQRLVQQQRETGDLTPKKVGTRKPSPLAAHQEVIVGIVEQHPDWTLWQYCEAVGEQSGVWVSTGSLCRFLAKHKLTLQQFANKTTTIMSYLKVSKITPQWWNQSRALSSVI